VTFDSGGPTSYGWSIVTMRLSGTVAKIWVFRVGPSNSANKILLYTRCHGNEIWDKMAFNAASVRDICKIFASIKGF